MTLDYEQEQAALKARIQSGIPEPTLEKIFSGTTKNLGIYTIQSLVHALGYTLNDIDPGTKKV